MLSLTDYTAYFEKLARQHKSVLHTEREPRFFILRGRDVTTKLSKTGDTIVVMESPEGVYIDNKSDNYLKEKTGAFAILQRVAADNFIQENATVDACEKIIHDFVTVMRRDNRDYNAELFGYLPLESISFYKVGPVFDGYYGIRVEFKFGDAISLCVNNNNWDFTKGI